MISKLINFLVELGIQAHQSGKHNQITRLINKICMFVILVIAPYMVLTLYYGSLLATFVQLTAIAALALIIYINSLYYFNLARILTLFIGNLHIFYMTLILGVESGVYFYFSAAIIAPLFFFTPRELKNILIFACLTIILAMTIHLLGTDFQPLVQTPVLLLTFFFYFSVFGSQATVFVFVYYFYLESNRFEKSLNETKKKLIKLSETDPLTRLPNRRSFNRHLKREWGKGGRNKKSCSIIMMDIDLFKMFNDFYGHQAGDVCLEQVAEVIAANIREFLDFPARYGGEEFIILLTDTCLEDALIIADRIREEVLSLAIAHELNKKQGVVTCSLGVSCCIPDKRSDPQDLIRLADKALYLAKENGRNRVEGRI